MDLLEISSESGKILIIREDCLSSCSEEVVVPDSNECEHHWNVFREIFCVSKVEIHVVCALQQLLKIFHAHVQRNGETNSRAQ